MTLEPHFHWNMPSTFKGKETWITEEKLTEEQAMRRNPYAWPVWRSMELRPVDEHLQASPLPAA